MGDNLPKPGDDKYLEFVDVWLSVKLKAKNDIQNLPVNYNSLFEELDDLVHDVVGNMAPGTMHCTCGFKKKTHAIDCRIFPHRTIYLKDTSGGKVGVPSLFLEPISWDEELFTLLLQSKEIIKH